MENINLSYGPERFTKFLQGKCMEFPDQKKCGLFMFSRDLENFEECREEYRKMHPTINLQPLTPCDGLIIRRAKKSAALYKKKGQFIFGVTYQEARKERT